MPIEIRELNIKATISDSGKKQQISKEDLGKLKEKIKKEILKECIDEIMQILQQKNER